jgi:acyl-CoA reductase-like NAD-dependent aldehyde dehydrogenase
MHQAWRIQDPATLEVVGEVPETTTEEVRRVCEVAADAQRHWRRLPALERGKMLHQTATLMRDDRAGLSALLTREGGKPRIENLDEVEWCAACLQYYAEIARNSHGASIPPTAEHQINFTVKEPLGVVGAIVPFNYPLLLLVWKIAPALAAGNTVVIKPSELTPLATLRMVEQSMAHLPKGVVNVITGGPAAGAALVDDPNVACIAFTGSTAVGTRIAVRAAEQLKRVNLELGGIDPLIVFGDADLDVAVPGAAWARFLNNGQVCTSAKRIYVVESIAADFIDRFVAHTATLTIGNGMDPSTDLGPMI